MSSVSLAAFLINALVQIPIIALVAIGAARAMHRMPARQQHRVWIVALIACLVLPLASMTPRRSSFVVGRSSPAVEQQRTTNSNQPFSLQILLERTQRPAARGVNAGALLAAGYGAFILIRIATLAIAWRRTRRILRAASVDVSDEVRARCGASLGDVDVPLLSSPAAEIPMTLGAASPVIIIPRALLDQLSDRALCAVVGHELAHIRRRDFLANLLIELATLPISFHPMTAMLKRRLAAARELACDEQVTPRVVAPRDYARALVDVAAFACAKPRPAYSLTMSGGDFEDRIRRIVRRANMRPSRKLLVIAWATLAASGAAAAGIAVHPRLDVSYPDATSADPQARAAAACKAGRARDDGAMPMLLAMLGDETSIPAAPCYDGLWTPALQSFHHPSPGEQAALALASISRPAIDSLVAALDDRAPAVRRNAAWAIGEARGGGMVDRDAALLPLIRLLHDNDATVRRAAAWGLSELKSHDAVEPLVVALGDGDPAVRGTAAFALGEIKDSRASKALTQMLNVDSDPEVRNAAYWALAEIRGD
jgi:beta-lactamase regulating signal transducer with metallopeptidase domain